MSTTDTELGGMWARLHAGLRRVFGGGDTNLRESIEDALDSAAVADAPPDAADLSPEERHMLRNLLGFRDVRVEQIAVPRADIIAVPHTATRAELLERFAACGHSRLPVYRETLDQPLGLIHIKDVMAALQKDAEGIDDLLRDILFVPPSMPALDLMRKMQATRAHVALVIDEYGGTDGLVTIGDLLEEIVGDIDDDGDAPLLRRTGTDRWHAAARLPLAALEQCVGRRFDAEEFDEVETLGGLVFALAGRVPQRGEIVAYRPETGASVEFVVRDADARRVKTLDIRRIAATGS